LLHSLRMSRPGMPIAASSRQPAGIAK
jgi:hypothetical protein